MSDAWIVVLAIGACTVVFKALGPVVIGGRQLPPRLAGVVALLAPTLLAALVVVSTFATGRTLVVDRTGGGHRGSRRGDRPPGAAARGHRCRRDRGRPRPRPVRPGLQPRPRGWP